MADLLTLTALARWTQSDEEEVLGDEFAADLISRVSELICFIGGHPNWSLELGENQAPVDVQMVALQVIKRSYENPGQILQAGSIGPLGGDRVADVQALFADLTDSERATVSKYNANGDPNPSEGELFVITTTRGDETTLPQTSPLYVGDNQQVGLAESADPREWKIKLFNPGDPGDDANYDAV